MDIIAIIAQALEAISKRGITVVCGWYDENINDTHITFCELTDRANSYSDDAEEEIVHTIQVDIWSKNDEWKLKKEVKKLMLSDGFGYIEGQEFFETETKIYHKSMRFNYIEEVV